VSWCPRTASRTIVQGIHQHTARIAIADLAASLLTYAIDDADGIDNSVWAALVDEIRDEMRANILESDLARAGPARHASRAATAATRCIRSLPWGN
jgi:hypothetical protein